MNKTQNCRHAENLAAQALPWKNVIAKTMRPRATGNSSSKPWIDLSFFGGGGGVVDSPKNSMATRGSADPSDAQAPANKA
mmetsp:Transcript_9388/g.7156  ORF Transcript_9388/g.7156 Transcript_9388/m.7156 type:complete len:80 (-) Transcript_9388:280-519(-)